MAKPPAIALLTATDQVALYSVLGTLLVQFVALSAALATTTIQTLGVTARICTEAPRAPPNAQ
jgi:hypothetical protein